MNRYSARTLLQYSTEDLWTRLTGAFIIRFDDGEEIVTDWRETLYSSYAWDFHREHPNTPLLKKHHVQSLIAGRRLGSSTHLELLGNAMWSVYDAYPDDPTATRDILAEKVYRLTNIMYVELSHRLEDYVVSLDILDFVDVLEHPKIKEIKQQMRPTQSSVIDTLKAVGSVLSNGIDLPKNPLSLALRSKLVSEGQTLQCIGPRGYLTDIDSQPFDYPIMRGYAEGIRLLYDSMIESRSAAISLQSSKGPLQDAEYFSRRLQLMCQVVRNLHRGDCGTKEYLLWKVRGRTMDEQGRILAPADLPILIGKKYLGEDGQLRTIREGDTHLVGKTLKLRSVIHCAHPDPYGVCTTCFGELSDSVPDGTNIGHMCCTSMTQKSSQAVMSLKHLVGNATPEPLGLQDGDRPYLKISTDGSSYLFADALKNKEVTLVIPSVQASNITDIFEVSDVRMLNINRVSELTDIGIIIKSGGAETSVELKVSAGAGRMSSMTYALLDHIRKNGWSPDEHDNYLIDMRGWDWSKPILTMPLVHASMSDHSKDIASMLESSVKDMEKRDKDVSGDAFLVELSDLVNSKLSVNLAVLDVVLYASMIRSAEKHDYRLPKPGTDRGLGVMKMSMNNRSLSAPMAFENHLEVFIDPLSYTESHRMNHPMDAVLLPAEVLGQSGHG